MKGFGYAFNGTGIMILILFHLFVYDKMIYNRCLLSDEGKLRKVNEKTGVITDTPYQYKVGSASYNKRRYRALGNIVTKHVYRRLTKIGLQKIYVKTSDDGPSSFVFANKPDVSQSKKLLILIHGNGVVRAGQWARSLIIYQSLDHGTQIPYIKKALKLGYDVLVTNTNLKVKKGDTAMTHADDVWKETLGSMKNVKSFAIVAHSYGGKVTADLSKKHPKVFRRKCFGIAFTDSVHSAADLSPKLLPKFKKIGVNWVKSSEPLNKKLESLPNDVPRRSAGHTKHEWTSWSCIVPLFKFLEKNYKKHQKQRS